MQETCQILADIRSHHQSTALWWLGNAGWAIKSDNVLLLIDAVIELDADDNPTISEINLPLARQLPLRANQLLGDELDLCLVTHAHGDHLARRTVSTLNEQTTCRFVVPRSCTEIISELGVAPERIIDADHGKPIQYKHLTISPMKALHGHLHGSVYEGANFQDCGYLVDDGCWTIFHPGDTVLLHEHLEMVPPDVFLVSITEHNMWVRNSALLANLWCPDIIVPMHYGTYDHEIFWTVGDPQQVLPHLEEAIRDRFVILDQGQQLLLRR